MGKSSRSSERAELGLPTVWPQLLVHYAQPKSRRFMRPLALAMHPVLEGPQTPSPLLCRVYRSGHASGRDHDCLRMAPSSSQHLLCVGL